MFMASLSFSSPSLYRKPPLFSYSRSSSPCPLPFPHKLRSKVDQGICRADFSRDAPLATAIGSCILSSFLLPVAKRVGDEEEDDSSAIVSTDMRLAAMGIISFIPFFNWLSWVFAWLDTGKRRYAVYALVYLLPYLSSNLSISPEESWLPITSIVLGIIHVQLEASIANGDIKTLQIFKNPSENFSSKKRARFDRNHGHFEEKEKDGK
ncbi:PREDICTED: uncharacterized protein LOC104809306 isoform X2 [Tarenaya hassleriana]|uniref:uncharacterized protein LOC104809306 isoform X2 n=1 Tax=Tarenaya hassleriana TaxID=28532 RepID=UPI00053C4FB7|nr:PREDICTED: uncharacterized protein LOC104809306 isoform X2 [Tarenaya hassleriana]